MEYKPITQQDLEEIRDLRPEGWQDIGPAFEFYIKSVFCRPIKTLEKDKIVGIGSYISFDKSCWIGHLIVDPNFRNRGIGQGVFNELLNYHRNDASDSCLLIATELGKPLYLKAGFREVTEYTFMQREKPWKKRSLNANVVSFREEHLQDIYKLDKKVCGETREKLLSSYLKNAKVYFKNNKLEGFYLPELVEGLIFAETEEAGCALMELKYSQEEKAVLPSDNLAGIKFLEDNGFVKTDKRGTRMIFGKDIQWDPQKIYSRIGGNFG